MSVESNVTNKKSDADGRYSGTVWLPRTGSVCTIASFVAGNETDDNAGLGWSIPVAPVGEGEEADSDGDGMPDAWEAAHALDPFADDASADADGDGISNLAEYENGLDPQTADPPPILTLLFPEDGAIL